MEVTGLELNNQKGGLSMKTCILCQKDFQDSEVIEHTLQDVVGAFRGNAVFETTESIVYLCNECEEQYKRCVAVGRNYEGTAQIPD